MLVIISDTHLTDGSSGHTISDRAFRIFRERVRDLAYEASWRERNGKRRYVPIESMDVLLLGDILDVIRSVQWGAYSPGAPRPWRDPNDEALINMIRQITNDILAHNRSSLDVLSSLTQGRVTLPPAVRGRPAKVGHEYSSDDRVPVNVRIHYMVGNHDWFYHLPGTEYNRIRSAVVKAMGLANDPNAPFPHEPEESPQMLQVMEDHKVYARHGDIFDPFNYEGDRDVSSLGDAIVIDLLNRFPAAVEDAAKDSLCDLDPFVIDGLRQIDNVRPLLLVPVWIDGLINRLCRDNKQIRAIKNIWNDLVDDFLRIEFVRERDTLNPLDDVDKLQFALRLSQGFSIRSASAALGWLARSGQTATVSYRQDAMNEPPFRSRRARAIVYGHTHHHEIVPLDVSFSGCGEVRQLYVNSGTWRRVYRQAVMSPGESEFLDYDVMTFIAFYKNDERCGRPFEVWSGALAV